jgi:[acyl-carrier-protein] S-malonyltransferase
MKAYVFPGQGAQFSGMGKDLFDASEVAQKRFKQADEILGFSVSDTMFSGSDEDLKETSVTQPAIFLHSVILAEILGDNFAPDMVAGHSLGEFSALVAAGSLKFEDGLRLVSERAQAMQAACDAAPSTMAAVLGLADELVEEICSKTEGIVVAANYNCPGQLVISGENAAVHAACAALTEAGARRALVLPVGGAFHSPLMESARARLSSAIAAAPFEAPRCPVIQNAITQPVVDPNEIRINLIAQLTAPVRWTQSMQKMIEMGAQEAIEVGPGKVLQGLFKKVDRAFPVSGASVEAN